LLACLPYFRNASCLEELDQRNLWRVKFLNNAIKDKIVWWGYTPFRNFHPSNAGHFR
jgi:hypothetical protein